MVALKKRWVHCCLAVLLSMLIPHVAGAERFADLRLGLAYTQDEDMGITYADNSTNEISMRFNASFTIGYRMGYWFERMPMLGLALDAGFAGVESKDTDDYIDVTSITPLLMFRVPLMKSQKYPTGEWAPYFAAGPGLFLSKISLSTNGDDYANRQEDIGADLRAGIKKMMATNWALNLEYRFFYVAPEYEDYDIDVDIDLYTHGLMIGMTYNF